MRTSVRKTWKMVVNGEFVRSESGRTFEHDGQQVPLASRKDVRDAVRAARQAQPGWASRRGYNRGQILYRLAEMVEGRLDGAVSDRLVHYAGWCDKAAQVLGAVNPVAGPYFSFSFPEPVGVVGIVAPGPGALPLATGVAAALAGGNAVVAYAPDPIVGLEFAEASVTSDLPPGVLNVVTGDFSSVASHLAAHRDVDCLAVPAPAQPYAEACSDSLKRLVELPREGWEDLAGIGWVERFVEIKTVWHPVGT
ncbi:MAG: aldehyde dehydrogenase family protein [Fimbriimonadaceae bacterium]|nr:aldehyde dehydrogenase family protein [Fimbriimonadaceae bacterium]QYK58912.1 MAG: aldehyde dehydrogenase family protein [Fimbriimonadaceae bacterium]